MVNENLFAGTTATTLELETAMNRTMLLTVIWRLEGKPAVSVQADFTDLASGAYYTDAVAWANESTL